MARVTILGDWTDNPDLTAPSTQASAIYGFQGNDNITGSALDDFIDGGQMTWHAIDDAGGFVPTTEDDIIDAGGGDDIVLAGSGSDTIDGGTGIDALVFTQFANFMVEGPKNVFSAKLIGMKNLHVDLGAGFYTADYINKGKTVAQALGTVFNFEAVTGTGFDDFIAGGIRDEFFRPLNGKDTIEGGGGYDILRYDTEAAGLSAKLGIIVDYATGEISDTEDDTDLFSGIEHVIGSKKNDDFIGDGHAQIFTGGDGKDTFEGGGGRDTINYTFETGTLGINVNLKTGKADDTFGDRDSIESVEIIKATQRNDNLVGSDAANELHGRGGNDEIDGGKGNDTLLGDTNRTDPEGGNDYLNGGDGKDKLYAGGGKDTVQGWLGNDTIDGGAGLDMLEAYVGDKKPIIINLTKGRAVYESRHETDILISIEHAKGANGDDLIIGNEVANALYGLDGDDTFVGGLGFDTLEGGNDFDTVDYSGSPLAVTADLGAGRVTFAGVEGVERLRQIESLWGSKLDDSLMGSKDKNELYGDDGNDILLGLDGNDGLYGEGGNDFVEGGAGRDYVDGGDGADTVIGGYGVDTVVGGGGKDVLTGENSADTFTFVRVGDSAVGDNRDVITDFTHKQHDIIDLSGIDANTHKSGNQDFDFIGKADFSSTSKKHVYGELRFEAGILSGDVNGDGEADFEIALAGVTKLVDKDFIL